MSEPMLQPAPLRFEPPPQRLTPFNPITIGQGGATTAILAKYTTDGKSYDLAQAIKDGITPDQLKGVGFTDDSIAQAQTYNNAITTLAKYTSDGKSYNIQQALRDGVKADTLLAAGFSKDQVSPQYVPLPSNIPIAQTVKADQLPKLSTGYKWVRVADAASFGAPITVLKPVPGAPDSSEVFTVEELNQAKGTAEQWQKAISSRGGISPGATLAAGMNPAMMDTVRAFAVDMKPAEVESLIKYVFGPDYAAEYQRYAMTVKTPEGEAKIVAAQKAGTSLDAQIKAASDLATQFDIDLDKASPESRARIESVAKAAGFTPEKYGEYYARDYLVAQTAKESAIKTAEAKVERDIGYAISQASSNEIVPKDKPTRIVQIRTVTPDILGEFTGTNVGVGDKIATLEYGSIILVGSGTDVGQVLSKKDVAKADLRPKIEAQATEALTSVSNADAKVILDNTAITHPELKGLSGDAYVMAALKAGVDAPILVKAGYSADMVNNAISNMAAEFQANNTRLPDGKMILTSQLNSYKETAPDIYNALVTKGFVGVNELVAKQTAALAQIPTKQLPGPPAPETGFAGLIVPDLYAYLQSNTDIKTGIVDHKAIQTAFDAGFDQEAVLSIADSIKQAQAPSGPSPEGSVWLSSQAMNPKDPNTSYAVKYSFGGQTFVTEVAGNKLGSAMASMVVKPTILDEANVLLAKPEAQLGILATGGITGVAGKIINVVVGTGILAATVPQQIKDIPNMPADQQISVFGHPVTLTKAEQLAISGAMDAAIIAATVSGIKGLKSPEATGLKVASVGRVSDQVANRSEVIDNALSAVSKEKAAIDTASPIGKAVVDIEGLPSVLKGIPTGIDKATDTIVRSSLEGSYNAFLKTGEFLDNAKTAAQRTLNNLPNMTEDAIRASLEGSYNAFLKTGEIIDNAKTATQTALNNIPKNIDKVSGNIVRTSLENSYNAFLKTGEFLDNAKMSVQTTIRNLPNMSEDAIRTSLEGAFNAFLKTGEFLDSAKNSTQESIKSIPAIVDRISENIVRSSLEGSYNAFLKTGEMLDNAKTSVQTTMKNLPTMTEDVIRASLEGSYNAFLKTGEIIDNAKTATQTALQNIPSNIDKVSDRIIRNYLENSYNAFLKTGEFLDNAKTAAQRTLNNLPNMTEDAIRASLEGSYNTFLKTGEIIDNAKNTLSKISIQTLEDDIVAARTQKPQLNALKGITNGIKQLDKALSTNDSIAISRALGDVDKSIADASNVITSGDTLAKLKEVQGNLKWLAGLNNDIARAMQDISDGIAQNDFALVTRGGQQLINIADNDTRLPVEVLQSMRDSGSFIIANANDYAKILSKTAELQAKDVAKINQAITEALNDTIAIWQRESDQILKLKYFKSLEDLSKKVADAEKAMHPPLDVAMKAQSGILFSDLDKILNMSDDEYKALWDANRAKYTLADYQIKDIELQKTQEQLNKIREAWQSFRNIKSTLTQSDIERMMTASDADYEAFLNKGTLADYQIKDIELLKVQEQLSKIREAWKSFADIKSTLTQEQIERLMSMSDADYSALQNMTLADYQVKEIELLKYQELIDKIRDAQKSFANIKSTFTQEQIERMMTASDADYEAMLRSGTLADYQIREIKAMKDMADNLKRLQEIRQVKTEFDAWAKRLEGMTDAEKNQLINDLKTGKKTELDKLMDDINQYLEDNKGSGSLTPEDRAKLDDIDNLREKLSKPLGEKPPERGGGIATEEKVETKTEVKPEPKTAEELEKELFPETKPKEESTTGAKPSERTSVGEQAPVTEAVSGLKIPTVEPIKSDITIKPFPIVPTPSTPKTPMEPTPMQPFQPLRVTTPVVAPVKDPFNQPYVDPFKDPFAQPKKEPVKEPTLEPIKEPIKEPVKEPERAPMPAFETPSPIPTPTPVPTPVPQPQPQPQPQLPKPQLQPIEVPVKPSRGIAIPLPSQQKIKEARDAGVPEGSYEWRQGTKWVFLPPPYEDIDKRFLDNPMPGTYRFATGRGSAKATIQVLGGIPTKPATIDMGWATVDVKIQNGIPMVEFTGGQEAANTRWEAERAKEDEQAQIQASQVQAIQAQAGQPQPMVPFQSRPALISDKEKLLQPSEMLLKKPKTVATENITQGAVKKSVRVSDQLVADQVLEGATTSEASTSDSLLQPSEYLIPGSTPVTSGDATGQQVLPPPDMIRRQRVSNLPELKKNELIQYHTGKLRIISVDQDYIRKHPDLFPGGEDFTMDGHHYVFSWIPVNEIWIAQNLTDYLDKKADLVHVISEYNDMANGMDYDTAHANANVKEEKGRRNPKLLDSLINIELAKIPNSVSKNEQINSTQEQSYEPPKNQAPIFRRRVLNPIASDIIEEEQDEEPVEELEEIPVGRPMGVTKRRKDSEPVALHSWYYMGQKLPDPDLSVNL